MTNKQKLIRKVPCNPLGSSWQNFFFLAISLAPETLRKSIRGSKDSYYSLESKQTLIRNIIFLSALWHHKRKTEKAKHTPTLTTSTKNPKPNLKSSFFSLNCKTSRVFRGFEQARNKFGTPGGAKSFLCGAQFFELCPIVSNYVQHIFLGGAKKILGAFASLGYGPGLE